MIWFCFGVDDELAIADPRRVVSVRDRVVADRGDIDRRAAGHVERSASALSTCIPVIERPVDLKHSQEARRWYSHTRSTA